ncbi:hypothetical protein [Pseudomonas citronellolis]|uniref:hypothetical protein n=1 Tax=Pseudomonas citronellolis TaxID=53408 RepID=UPI00108095AD|nr:hypothetical protein [Pseudomonas citronellolis]
MQKVDSLDAILLGPFQSLADALFPLAPNNVDQDQFAGVTIVAAAGSERALRNVRYPLAANPMGDCRPSSVQPRNDKAELHGLQVVGERGELFGFDENAVCRADLEVKDIAHNVVLPCKMLIIWMWLIRVILRRPEEPGSLDIAAHFGQHAGEASQQRGLKFGTRRAQLFVGRCRR